MMARLLTSVLLAAPAPLTGCTGKNCLKDPGYLGFPTISLQTGATAVVDTLTTIAGIVSVIFLVVGGIRYITSDGDSSRVASAKNTAIYAVLGLVVAIMARVIVGFAIGNGP